MILGKIRKKLSYEKYDQVIYDKRLKEAYSGNSVCGGSLKDQRVLITGASGDIGTSLAIRFIDEGCRVVLAGRSDQKLTDVISYILNRRPNCKLSKVVFDMMDLKTISSTIQEFEKKKEKIDIIVLNAGFFCADDRNGEFRNYKKENFFISWKTNYIGVAYLCDIMAEYMVKNNGKKLILISSICALQKKLRYTPYGMSKSASTEFMREIQKKYPSLSISIIFPGSIATKMGNIKEGDNIARKCNKLNHIILPEEIASLAAFLSSEVGQYVKDGIVASACEVL